MNLKFFFNMNKIWFIVYVYLSNVGKNEDIIVRFFFYCSWCDVLCFLIFFSNRLRFVSGLCFSVVSIIN